MNELFTNKIVSVTIILPCYNEEAILEPNVRKVIGYMNGKSSKYKWDILLINDGSKDKTPEIANALAREFDTVRVIHHPTNLNLGHALQTGFKNATGEIIVVLDLDLSYSETYIEEMVDVLIDKAADIVVASPYMKGGKVTAVPFSRRIMSKWVNKFMRWSAQDKFHTFTAMARAYRTSFIRTLNLKTKDYEINPEILYKAMILRARIVEIPAHLDWTEQNKYKETRTSAMRVVRGLFSGIMSAFIFRPYIFFIAIGSVLMLLSLYELVWLFSDTIRDMKLFVSTAHDNAFSASLYSQFKKNPQSFIVGGVTFIAAVQFLSLGFLSLQNKRYFEELFHLGTSIKKQTDKSNN